MEAKFFASVFSLLSIFVAIYAQSKPDLLVPNYDVPSKNIKVFYIGQPLVLSCHSAENADLNLIWEKNGTDVAKIKSLQGRFNVRDIESEFIILRTEAHDDGLYSCVNDNQKADIQVVARLVVRLPTDVDVVEGEKLTIVCTVVGTDPQLSWMIPNNNQTISNSTDRYILKADENNIQNAILEIENVRLSDKGEYKCIGSNAADEFGTYLGLSDVMHVGVSQSSRSCCALSLYFVLLLSTMLTFSSLRKY